MTDAIYQCECPLCQSEDAHPEQALHHQMNLLMSRMDEQQRRWYSALEAKQFGHGGMKRIAQITGLDEKTIRRGIRELDNDLVQRPQERIRLPGGGRPRTEKKTPH